MSGDTMVEKRMLYQKKPIVIEAMQFETNNAQAKEQMDAVVAWINGNVQANDPRLVGDVASHDGTSIFIRTMEGTMIASVGDWIIRGIKGEICLCKPDVFEATYEPVDNGEAWMLAWMRGY